MKYRICAVLMFFFYGVSAQLPVDGLIAYYPMNNDARDKSGNNENGTLTSGVSVAEDRFGNACGALHFNGVDGYVRVLNSSLLKSPVNAITISAWFKLEKGIGASSDVDIPLLSKSGGDNQTTKAQYRLVLKRTFGNSYSDISLSSDFTTRDNKYPSHPVEFDRWTFLAITYDENFIQIYQDGNLIWQAMNNKPLNPGDLHLEIGRDLTEGKRYFKGCMDDVRIYNRGLSANEILALFNDVSGKSAGKFLVIDVLSDIKKNTDPGKCAALVNFTEPTANSGCGKIELKQVKGQPAGSLFESGKNVLSYEATLPSGAKMVDSFSIIVSDMESPLLKCPDDILAKAPANTSKLKIEYPKVSASDNCPGLNLKLVSGPASGDEFPIGSTVIKYLATDASGNKSECSFSIRVIENIQPVVHCTKDIKVYTKGPGNTVVVNYDEPYADLKNNRITLKRTAGNLSGSAFPVGKSEIFYESADTSAGNASCHFSIMVLDTIPPVILCPSDIRKKCEPGQNSLLVNYTEPRAMDGGVSVPVKLVSGLASGSDFPLGKTVLNFMTSDASGNKSECGFNVIVEAREVVPVEKEKVKDPVKPLELPKPETIPVAAAASNEKNKEREKAAPAKEEIKEKVAESQTVPLPNAQPKEVIKPVASGTAKEKIKAAEEAFFPAPSTETKPEKKPEQKTAPAIDVKEKIIEPKTQPTPSAQSKEINKPTETKASKQKIIEAEKAFFSETVESKVEKKPEAKTVTIPAVDEKTKNPESQKPVSAPIAEQQVKEMPSSKNAPVAETVKEEKSLPETIPAVKPLKNAEAKPATSVAELTKPKDTAPNKVLKSRKAMRLTCSENLMKRNDLGQCGAIVNYVVPQIQNGQEVKLVQSKGKGSGSFFSLGTTQNLYSATDASGFMKECGFDVTIRDQESPVFDCPEDTVIWLPSNRRGIIYYYKDPEVRDNCGIDSIIQVAGSKNGCFLQIGVHPFIYKAIDAAGNYQICTHSVIIKEAAPTLNIEPPKKLDAQLSLGSDSVHYEYKSEVNDCFLTVFIYDDGEQDNDTVSVIFNGQVIVDRDMIRIAEHGMIKRYLVLDQGNQNYLISKAWNTGKYGLNTLRIDVYEGNIENEKKELKYKKPITSKVLHSRPGSAGGIILKCKR